MEHRRWIVVGTDFSSVAEKALERAAALASALGAGLACVHVYEDPPGTRAESDPAPAIRARLESAVARVGMRFPAVRLECFVRRGAPWDKLANVASDLGAELIVVGCRGEHAPAGSSFLGRVVTRIASISNRAVLVVPPEDAGASFAA
jgi:nucleotide-binding universal stress UspA family protein